MRLMSVAGACLVASAACSSMGVRVHGRVPNQQPLFGGTMRDTSSVGPSTPGGRTTGRSHSASFETRRICRSSAWPSGWIAIAYESSPKECPSSSERVSYNVATIARYDTQARGQTLEVCADQTIPRGWIREGDDDTTGDACPGAGKGDASVTRRIRRID